MKPSIYCISSYIIKRKINNREFLPNLKIFSNLEDKALFQIASYLEPILVYPGSDIICQGDILDSIFLLQVSVITTYIIFKIYTK